MTQSYKYRRVLLKLSGEALMGEAGYGIDPKVVDELADQVKEIVEDGIDPFVPRRLHEGIEDEHLVVDHRYAVDPFADMQIGDVQKPHAPPLLSCRM